jgi:CRP-like cAMP-binding protein
MIAIMSEAFSKRLKALSHREMAVAANEHVFQIAAPVVCLFVVAEGAVQLERHSPSGTRLILQRARAGDVLAEASCFASHYHCSGVAVQPSFLLSIPMKSFTAKCRSDPLLALAFAEHLARETQSARARSEILSLKTVSARLDAWLEMGDGRLPAKGEWTDLAGMLCVTPEALYRELSRRRKLTGLG